MHRSSAKDEVGKMHEQKWSSLEWEAKQYPFISNKYRKVANRMHKERVIRDSFIYPANSISKLKIYIYVIAWSFQFQGAKGITDILQSMPVKQIKVCHKIIWLLHNIQANFHIRVCFDWKYIAFFLNSGFKAVGS